MMLKLLLVRHAESLGNVEQRMQGHSSFELSPEGVMQVQRLAQRLLNEAWWPTKIYSSPLVRAAQTTKILVNTVLKSPSNPVEYVDDLSEFQNGIFQGLTWTEAQQLYPDLCDKLERSRDWLPIPGAETLEEGRNRARRFIQTVMQHHNNQDALWVITHEWILQHLIAEVLGCYHTWKIAIGYTARFEFWMDRDRWQCQDANRFNSELWQIRHFNDSSHLSVNQ
jgi:2,3-bisphosphoglycerate-dependent phosphoglycerate mutase